MDSTFLLAQAQNLKDPPFSYTFYADANLRGMPTNPDWYHNIVAHPDVTVEVGTETFEARATVVEGPERDELYAKQAAIMPNFAEYQEKTTRKIPVIVLTRKQ